MCACAYVDRKEYTMIIQSEAGNDDDNEDRLDV